MSVVGKVYPKEIIYEQQDNVLRNKFSTPVSGLITQAEAAMLRTAVEGLYGTGLTEEQSEILEKAENLIDGVLGVAEGRMAALHAVFNAHDLNSDGSVVGPAVST